MALYFKDNGNIEYYQLPFSSRAITIFYSTLSQQLPIHLYQMNDLYTPFTYTILKRKKKPFREEEKRRSNTQTPETSCQHVLYQLLP